MTKIIALHSFRGGTGKSNVTANTAYLLAQAGNKIGIIDTDIQSPGIHVIFNLTEKQVKNTLNDFLWGNCAIEEAAYRVELPGLPADGQVYLVPSSIKANDIARVLRDRYDPNALNDGFRDLIAAHDLDYLLIDSHPGLNEETLLSIAISDALIIVLRPDQQDFQGTHVTVEVARRLKVPEIMLVVNKVPPDYDFADVKRKVEQAYNCQVATLLPLSMDVAHTASSQIFCIQEPEHPFSQGVAELAHRLIEL
ncbi:MAG: MinD/ParA family protein [Chloroflexota bacterium]